MAANTSWTGDRRAFPKAVRRRILERDGHRCRYCGEPGNIADHIVAVAEGGTDDESNGQTLCERCHDIKTKQEAARGRARLPRRQRPAERHPGLL